MTFMTFNGRVAFAFREECFVELTMTWRWKLSTKQNRFAFLDGVRMRWVVDTKIVLVCRSAVTPSMPTSRALSHRIMDEQISAFSVKQNERRISYFCEVSVSLHLSYIGVCVVVEQWHPTRDARRLSCYCAKNVGMNLHKIWIFLHFVRIEHKTRRAKR